MADLVECAECGRKFKKITESHVKTHGLTLEEYVMKYESEPEVKEDPDKETEEVMKDTTEKKKEAVKQEVKSRVFDFKEKAYAELPLQEFLDEFDISEKDLRAITKQYKQGIPISTKQEMESKRKAASNAIQDLKNLDHCEVTELQAAEILVKEHGFTVTNVRGRHGGKPKTWVLEK